MPKRKKQLTAKASLFLLATNYLLSGGQITGAQTATSAHSGFRPGAVRSNNSFLPSGNSNAGNSSQSTGALPTLPATSLGNGFLLLSPNIGQLLQNLVIPKGVKAVYDFGFNPTLNLPGNLINNGTLYAVSSNSSVSLATINSLNIFNNGGGVLTSILPAHGIPGFSHLNSNFSLALNAVNNIVNAGMVSSAGNLSFSAGGSITNALPAGVSMATPVMQALGNVHLYAGLGNITNSGVISAIAGNVNVSAAQSSNIVIQNTNGVMQALAGVINVRDNDFASKANLNILGGNLLANAINLNSGCGTVDVLARNVSGVVNVKAAETHVSAATNNLVLGNIEVSGDPAFYNTAALGDITIAGPLQFSGQDLAIVASRNVLTAPGAGIIDTSSSTGRGGDITIIAGANFTTSAFGPTAPGSVLPNVPDANDANISLMVTGSSSSGGRIDLTGGGSAPITAFTSSSTAGRGGNVRLAAFAGTDAQSGTIKTPSAVTITTGGAGGSMSAANGNVLIIAGSKSGQVLDIGPINTSNTTGTSSASQTGSINIALAQPVILNTQLVIKGGTVTSGSLVASNTAPTAAVSTGNLDLQTEEGFTISSPGALSIGTLSVSGNGGVIASGKDFSSTGSVNIVSAEATGLGRPVQIVAGAQVTYDCGFCSSTTPGINVIVSPSTINGGNIDMSASSSVTIDTSANSGNSTAGRISLVSFAGGSSSGSITLPSNSSLKATGSGSGLNGNVSVIGASNISLGSLEGNQVSVVSSQPVSSANNSIVYDYRGRQITTISFGAATGLDSFVDSTAKTGNIAISGDISVASQLNVVTGGSATISATKTVSADATAANSPAGNIFVSATSITAGSLSADGQGTGDGGNITLKASTSDITTSNITSTGNRAGAISLLAAKGAITAGNLSSAGQQGGNITAIASKNIQLNNVDSSATVGDAGYLLVSTGNASSSSTITVSSVTTQGMSGGGLVLLVNSSKDSSSTNLTVGSISTDASGLDGIAGPVSLVSRGGIAISNISAKATNNVASTTARGGSVFISSGGTGTTAITASNINIDTSATNNGASDIAGSIIFLTNAASTGADPANIDRSSSTFSASGGTSRTPFFWGLNGASANIPNNLNVTASSSINIAPGGYQNVLGSSASPLNLTLDTGDDTQIVVPINTGAGDPSLPNTGQGIFLSSITQASAAAKDNIALFSTGPIRISQNPNVTKSTGYYFMVSPSELDNAAVSGQMSVFAGTIALATVGNVRIDNQQYITLTASKNISLMGNLVSNTNNNSSLNSDVFLNSGGSILTQNIGSTCCANFSGTISLSATGNISTQKIVVGDGTNISATAGGFVSTGIISAAARNSGGSGVRIVSGTYTSVGDISTGSNLQASGAVSISSATTISTGNIYTNGSAPGSINLNANGAISTLNLNANPGGGQAGGTVLVSSANSSLSIASISAGNVWGGQIMLKSASYTDVGDLNAIGGHGESTSTGIGSGGIVINSGSDVNIGNTYNFTTNCCGVLGPSDFSITAGGSVRYQNIRTGYTNNDVGGNILITAGSSINGFTIITKDSSGGNVSLVAGNQISIASIDAGTLGCVGPCRGGNVVAIAMGGKITISGPINTNVTQGNGGSISLTSNSAISVQNVNTSSGSSGGSAGSVFVSSGSTNNNAVSLGTIDTSSANSSIAGSPGNIFVGANSAGANGPSATGSAAISYNLISKYSKATPSPYLFYDSAPSSITTDTTVSVKSGSVTIHPGVYASDIGSSATPVVLTLDVGLPDDRTIVPIASQGNVYLSGFNASRIIVASTGSTGVSLKGNITATGTALISLYAIGANGLISQTSGKNIVGDTLNLFALQPSGDIGSSGQPINATANTFNAFIGNSSNLYLNNNVSFSTIGSITSGGNVSLISSNGLLVGMISSPGKVELQVASGSISSSYSSRIAAADLSVTAASDITLNTATDKLTLSATTGVATIKNASTLLNLGNASATTMTISNPGAIYLTGIISGGKVSILPILGLSAQAGSSISPSTSLSITTSRGIDIGAGVLSLTPGSNAGKGAVLTLKSGGLVHVDGSITSTPYGQVVISTGSTIPFVIGPGNTSLNGVNGTLNVSGTGIVAGGGIVSVTNSLNGGIVVLDPAYIIATQPGATPSTGGSVTLNANSAPLQFLSNVAAATLNANGYAGANGGSISLTGNPISVSANANLLLSNDGTYDGNLGKIEVINGAVSPLVIGNGLGQISISGSGGGKSFLASSQNTLTVSMNAVNYDKPGFRTTLNFSGSSLRVFGDIDVSGTPGTDSLQSITLSSNSSTNGPFTIDPAYLGLNGVSGKLIANGVNGSGGAITINAPNPGIAVLDPSYISVSPTGSPAGMGGQISLLAGSATVSISFAAGNKNSNGVLTGTLSVDSIGTSNITGNANPSLTISGALQINGGNLILSANGGGDNTSVAGKITLNSTAINSTIGSGVGEFQAFANSSINGGTAGKITINLNQSTAVLNINAASISATAPASFIGDSANGGTIVIQNNIFGNSSVVNLLGGVLSANGAGASGKGGAITIKDSFINASSNTTLSVDGQGQAGSVSLFLSDATKTTRLGVANNEFQISAAGGGGFVNIDTQGTLQMVGPASVLNAVDSDAYLYFKHIDYSNGFIDLGTGTLQLTTNVSQDINIGGLTLGSSSLDLTVGVLARTNAGRLFIGNPFATSFGNPVAGNAQAIFTYIPFPGARENTLNVGNINILSDLDLRKFGTVVIDSVGSFNAQNKTIIAPTKAFQVVQGGDLISGTIIGGSRSSIDLVQWNINNKPNFNFIVSGPIMTYGGGSVGLYTGAKSTVVFGSNIGGGAFTTIGLGYASSLTQTSGIISGNTLTLIAQTSIGGQPPQDVLYSNQNILTVDTRNISATAYGDVYVNNIGTSRLNVQQSVVGGTFYLTSSAPIVTVGSILATAVLLGTNAGSDAGITIGATVHGTMLSSRTDDTNHSVALSADGSGRIVLTSGQIFGPDILLQTGGGSIGSSLTPVEINSERLQVNIATGFKGSAYIHSQNSFTQDLELKDSQAGSNFQIVHDGSIKINNIATGNGFIAVTSNGVFGNVQVMKNSILNAVNGNLTITSSRNIAIQQGVSLNASSQLNGIGNIYLNAGSNLIQNGATPSNTVINESNGGKVHFSLKGQITTSSPTNLITADTHDVVLASLQTGAAITLGGDVKISARPVSHYLNSVDLTDPKNVAQIQTLIADGVLSGNLQVDGGIATGGSVTIPQDVLVGGLGLYSLKIPRNVTVNFTGTWTADTKLNVNLGVCSNCTQVVQQGNLVFPNGSNLVINLGMPNQNGKKDFMNSNLISASTKTIYVKLDNSEFYAAPVTSGPNPYLDDCPTGPDGLPAPASNAKPPGTFSPAACSGGAGEANKGTAGGQAANATNGGFGESNDNTGPPPKAPNLAISPKQLAKGRSDFVKCKEAQRKEDCETQSEGNFGNQRFGSLDGIVIPDTEDLKNVVDQLRRDSWANLVNNCHGTSNYIATGGASQETRGGMLAPLAPLVTALALTQAYSRDTKGSATRAPANNPSANWLNPDHFSPDNGKFDSPVKFNPCSDFSDFKPGDVIEVLDSNGKVTHSATVTNVDNSGRPTWVVETTGPGTNDLHSRSYDGFLRTNSSAGSRGVLQNNYQVTRRF